MMDSVTMMCGIVVGIVIMIGTKKVLENYYK
jgi:hypothetical protein